jgi:class 3 adenylate cyclase
MVRVNAARYKMGLARRDIRIGLHSGGAIAGVVGKKKFTYDIRGDAVNVAALMEAHAEPGQILLSDSTFGRVRGAFDTVPRDEIESAKKGRVRCHVLNGRKDRS